MTVDEALNVVAVERGRWGYPMQPPCSEDRIQDLIGQARLALRAELPAEYLDLLRKHNGIAENGLAIYADLLTRNVVSDLLKRELIIPGVVEQNIEFRIDRPGYEHLVVFAQDGLYVYASDPANARFLKIPHDSDIPAEEYTTFQQMIVAAIANALQ